MLTTKALVAVGDRDKLGASCFIHWPSVFIMKILRVSDWKDAYSNIKVISMNEFLDSGYKILKAQYADLDDNPKDTQLEKLKHEYDTFYDIKDENEHYMEIILWDYYMFIKNEMEQHMNEIIENSDVVYTLWMNEEFKGSNVYNQILALPNYED